MGGGLAYELSGVFGHAICCGTLFSFSFSFSFVFNCWTGLYSIGILSVVVIIALRWLAWYPMKAGSKGTWVMALTQESGIAFLPATGNTVTFSGGLVLSFPIPILLFLFILQPIVNYYPYIAMLILGEWSSAIPVLLTQC